MWTGLESGPSVIVVCYITSSRGFFSWKRTIYRSNFPFTSFFIFISIGLNNVVNTMRGLQTLSVLSWLPVMTRPSMTPNTQMGWWWALSLWLILHSGDSGEVHACEPLTPIGVESSLCVVMGTVLDWVLNFRVVLGEERLTGELSRKGTFKLVLQGVPRVKNSNVPSKRATTIWGLEDTKQKQLEWVVHFFFFHLSSMSVLWCNTILKNTFKFYLPGKKLSFVTPVFPSRET